MGTLASHLAGTDRRVLVAGAVVILIAATGLWALGDALSPWLSFGLVALMVVAALPDSFKAKVLELIGALVVGTVVLLGFNVVVDKVVAAVGWFEDGPPLWGIALGLPVALVVFGLAAYWYLRARGHWGRGPSGAFAAAAALFFVMALPILLGKSEPRAQGVQEARRVVSTLDVFIVAERPQRSLELPGFERDPALRGFDVRYSVGFAEGGKVRWTLRAGTDEREAVRAVAAGGATAGTPPTPRDGDRVLVLLVDGTPPAVESPGDLPDVRERTGEVARWREVARSAVPRATPTYALLQTTRRQRLARWRDLAAPIRALSVQKLASRTVTDAAVRLAVAAPTASEDYALALRHRPVLLFDGREPVPRPLSIQALFENGKVRQCRDRGATGTDCSQPVTDPRDLENGGTRLELDLPKSSQLKRVARRELSASAGTTPAGAGAKGGVALPATGDGRAPGTPPPGTPPPATPPSVSRPDASPGLPLSTIYVHPTSREVNGKSRLYLDYWWYLPDNPARAGSGAFCGAGLVVPGISCFNHQSDWEGVTVVVDRTESPRRQSRPRVIAVHYAQHASVVRHSWPQLHRHWDGERSLAQFVGRVTDAAERPLVFIASGTHASYPTPCPGPVRRTPCRQVAHSLEEQRYNGRLPWAGNNAGECGEGSSCLQMLPTRIGGTEPALWNAFKGPWGKRRCILEYYCDSTSPPSAPGTQGRYIHPARFHGNGDLENVRRPYRAGTSFDE